MSWRGLFIPFTIPMTKSTKHKPRKPKNLPTCSNAPHSRVAPLAGATAEGAVLAPSFSFAVPSSSIANLPLLPPRPPPSPPKQNSPKTREARERRREKERERERDLVFVSRRGKTLKRPKTFTSGHRCYWNLELGTEIAYLFCVMAHWGFLIGPFTFSNFLLVFSVCLFVWFAFDLFCLFCFNLT